MKFFFAALTSICVFFAIAAAQDEPTEVPIRKRAQQKLTETGAVMGPYEIFPEKHVSAWCMISTGKLKEGGRDLLATVPDAIPYAGIARSLVSRIIGLEKGDVQCAGYVTKKPKIGWAKRRELANAKLTLNFKSWADGNVQAEVAHPCVTAKARCLHQNRRESGPGTDALTACLNIVNRDTNEVASIVFAVENEDDETSPKFPAEITEDIGARPVGCDQRAY